MFFTGESAVFRNKNNRLLDSIFSRGLLCMCVFCLLNTLFVVVIKKPAIKQGSLVVQKQTPHSLQVKPVKLHSLKGKFKVFSKSLLRTILENCLYAPNHASLPGAEADDEVKKVEYIAMPHASLIYHAAIISKLGVNYCPFLTSNPFLDTLTPPPKRVA